MLISVLDASASLRLASLRLNEKLRCSKRFTVIYLHRLSLLLSPSSLLTKALFLLDSNQEPASSSVRDESRSSLRTTYLESKATCLAKEGSVRMIGKPVLGRRGGEERGSRVVRHVSFRLSFFPLSPLPSSWSFTEPLPLNFIH